MTARNDVVVVSCPVATVRPIFDASPDVGAIEQSHAECDPLLFLNQSEQAFPGARCRLMDENL